MGVTISATGPTVAGTDTLEERQRESGGLAGAGLRAADDVLARDDRGDGLLLDGGGGVVAHGADGLKQAFVQAQIVETQVVTLHSCAPMRRHCV